MAEENGRIDEMAEADTDFFTLLVEGKYDEAVRKMKNELKTHPGIMIEFAEFIGMASAEVREQIDAALERLGSGAEGEESQEETEDNVEPGD